MGRSRLEGFARSCLLLVLASYCSSRGGADSSVKVLMSDVVEAEIGEMAVIKCQTSIPENHSYTYVFWYSMEKHLNDKMERKKIVEMINGNEVHNDSEAKSRFLVASNFSLLIRKVTPQDAKMYICKVGLGGPGVAENRTELRVSKAPEMPEIQKENRGLTAGDPKMQEIAKCVSHNGYPTPTITWYKDNDPLGPDRNDTEVHFAVTRESSGLMTVHSTLMARVTKEDRESTFHCQVNYVLMGINKTAESDHFRVDVYYPSENVTFEIEPPGQEVKEGDNITLRCKADGNPEPLYTLYSVKGEKEEELPNISGVYVFTSIKREDSGVYQCKVLDFEVTAAIELSAELNLLVNYIDVPTFSSPSPVNVDIGKDLKITCKAKGSKPLEVHWEKKGTRIANGTQLILNAVNYESLGKYTCITTMPGFSNYFKSKQVLVTVIGKPHVFAQKQTMYVQVGEQVNFTCEVYSVSPVNITWSEPNGTAHKAKHGHQHHISVFMVKITDSLLESGLNCSAKNSKGESWYHFRVKQVVTTPPSSRAESKKESKGVIIVAVIICILLIAVLGAVLYFLHKKGRLHCSRSGKQEITRPEAHKNEIVVEVKSDKLPEEAGLLQGANGEKRSPGDQGEKYIDLRN
uniref:Melanoma cell adhesion molecule n=1 Tax=Salvator merianae TaxID=96440 RepID=A0A8D0KNR8_SALMN